MDTTTEAGHSSGEVIAQVICITGRMDEKYYDDLQNLIAEHQESWTMFVSPDDVVNEVRSGRMQGWVYYEEEVALGVCFTSIHEYVSGITTLRLEFVVGNNLFHYAKHVALADDIARRVGAMYIESVVDPRLARYLAKKHGYRAPGVWMVKNVNERLS